MKQKQSDEIGKKAQDSPSDNAYNCAAKVPCSDLSQIRGDAPRIGL